MAVDVRGVATVTASPRRLLVDTSEVRGRVLITSEVRGVERVPVVRNVDSFLTVASFCERTAEAPRTVGEEDPFTTLTFRSAETTELRVMVRLVLLPATRAEPPEIVCRVDPL